MNVNKYINFDIFTNILTWLDYESIKQFLLTNKVIYEYYKNNNRFISLLIIKKIDEKFNIQCLDKRNKLEGKQIDNVSIIYNRVYNQFKRQKMINLTDIIIYLIENKYDDSIYILKKLVSLCVLRVNAYTDSMNVIMHNDMVYLLVYSNVEESKLILDNFTIPISVMSYAIQEILYNRKVDYKKKLCRMIDYIYCKYCWKMVENMNNVYIHRILVHFIKNNQQKMIRYFLKKKRYYKYNLIYQTLINDCLSYDSVGCLKLLIREMENDSKLLKIYITVDKEILEKVVKKGSFYIIKYIIDNLLGNFINMNGYILSICNGIIYYNGNKFTKYVKKLKMLECYFDDKSKVMINNCLENNIKNVNNIYLV